MLGGLIFPGTPLGSRSSSAALIDLITAGCWIFAFASGRGHWMGPVVGLVMVFYGVFTIYLATFNYLADSYTIYASSALSTSLRRLRRSSFTDLRTLL